MITDLPLYFIHLPRGSKYVLLTSFALLIWYDAHTLKVLLIIILDTLQVVKKIKCFLSMLNDPVEPTIRFDHSDNLRMI